MPSERIELNTLLQPQERLDRLIAETFRRLGPRVVDLSYANPYHGPDAEVRAALQRATVDMGGRAFQYTPYGGGTPVRRAVASRLSREYGLPFHYQDVTMTTGAMTALNVVFRALFGSEDEVLVLTPCWQDYPTYLSNLGVPFTFVPLAADKHLDVDAVGRAITPRTRGILFSQPCCPTGVLYRSDELEALSGVLREAEARLGTSIYLVSDEVYRHVIWSRQAFTSPLLSYPRSLSVYSFGKALALQGQRIGYAAVSPLMPEREEVRERLRRCVRMMGFGTPTSLMQHVVCELIEYRPLLTVQAHTQQLVRRALADCGYEILPGGAAFYVYARSPVADDFRFAEMLAAQGVLVIPSTVFHEPGYIRLSLTDRVEAIRRGLSAFRAVHAPAGVA